MTVSERAGKIVRALDFPPFREVSGRGALFDLIPPSKRCGIYVLGFKTGELYAGQAIDVARRFAQHVGDHGDVTHFTYRCVSRAKLTEVEREVIWTLEREGLPLRNVLFTSLPKGEADLDAVWNNADQVKWTASSEWSDLGGKRPEDAVQRRKYERSIVKFVAKPASDEVIALLRVYLRRMLPAPRRTELTFWSLTCLPEARVYARLNLNMMEVLTLFEWEGELCASFHLSRSPLEQVYGPGCRGFFRKHREAELGSRLYDPGGEDQLNIVSTIQDAGGMLSDGAVVAAARLMNWRLMKKGPCMYSRYHSFPLADLVFAGL